MPDTWTLAIDFGTSNTAAAHRLGRGEAVTLPLNHQGNLMPSAVFLGEDGIEVGLSAVNRAAAAPSAFLSSPKRFVDSGTAVVDGREVQVVDFIAAVLSRVLDTARDHHAGSSPDRLVLTHPEAWSPAAQERLVEAASVLSYPRDRVTLVSEPRAAAHFYSHTRPLAPGGRVVVFDYGGGTLDVAVLEQDGPAFRVIAARGDNSLGGRNVDAALRHWVDEQLDEDHPDVRTYLDTRATPGVLQALDHSIRGAKELLSDTSTATVSISTPEGETGLLLSRAEFERLVESDVSRAVEITAATLRDAGVPESGHGATIVYLTGGSARIPYVQDRLGEIARVERLDDPKTVVARGALYAAESVGAGPVSNRHPTGRNRAIPTPETSGAPAHPVPTAAFSSTPPVTGQNSRPHGGPVTASRPVRSPDRPKRAGRSGILAGVGIVAVAVIAALVWAGLRFLGGPPDDPRLPVKGLTGAAASTLPNAYLDKVRSCDEPKQSRSAWTETKMSQSNCFWKDTDTMKAAYGAILTYVSNDPVQSKALVDAAAASAAGSSHQVDTVRKDSRGWPLVTVTYLRNNPRTYDLGITYPDESVTVAATSLDSREKAEAFARDLGFLK